MIGSDRVIVVRILGTGVTSDPTEPLTLTSRAGLSYLPATTFNGVIAEMGAQFSSEIPMFGSLGSDPTTYFTILSTTETLAFAMSRATSPLRNTTDNSAVRTSRYIKPTPTPTIYCDDTTGLYEGDLVRIGGSALRVTAVPSSVAFDAEYIFGSSPVPVPLQIFGSARPRGAVINAIRLNGKDYPSGGIEQLPVIISTAPVGANFQSEEEVIFRGMVSKVTLDTSARGTNQIKVDCSSIMGMIRNTPFRPVPLQPYVWLDQDNASATALDLVNPVNVSRLNLETVWDPRLQGDPWEATLGGYYDTRVGLLQLRKDKTGGVFRVSATSDYGDYYTIRAESSTAAGEETVSVGGFLYYFSEGVYARGVAPALTVDYEQNFTVPSGALGGRLTNGNGLSSDWSGEVCFTASTVRELVIDLLFGTYDSDANGTQGARPAGMAAWLPFGWPSIPDIINYGELRAVFNDDTQEALPYIADSKTVLPYLHADAKTVGDVLDWLLKRTGAFMVYDRGQLRFGTWANAGTWPIEIGDAALAEPRVFLDFDRDNAVQQIEVDWAGSVRDKDIVRTKIPVVNTDRALSGSGKILRLGNFSIPYRTTGGLETSQALQMALGMIVRYSKAAAVVEVTYRDAVHDLSVGQFISFSSAYVPNALGEMGVQSVRGFVIKAARSWKTPTTTYTLWLYGYATASARIGLLSSSGVVREQISPTEQRIEDNVYSVAAPSTRPGAPTTDADSFAQTLARTKKPGIPVQLLDEYGTPRLVTSVLIAADPVTGVLEFDDSNFDGVTRPGDVIVIADAATIKAYDLEVLEAMWDTIQATDSGDVASDEALAFPWMV